MDVCLTKRSGFRACVASGARVSLCIVRLVRARRIAVPIRRSSAARFGRLRCTGLGRRTALGPADCPTILLFFLRILYFTFFFRRNIESSLVWSTGTVVRPIFAYFQRSPRAGSVVWLWQRTLAL